MISLDHNLVLVIFLVTTTVGMVGKFYKWCKRDTVSDKLLTKLQIRYFVCYFSFMSGFIFQGPYVHQRYHETGMTPDQINNIMSCFNIVSAFWGFFVGSFCELLGHKRLIILSAIILGSHAVCRAIGGYKLFCLASILLGLSTASNRVVFEDFLADQIEEIGSPQGAQNIVKENSALLNLIISVATTPISQAISSQYGAKSAFIGAALLFFSSSIVILILMPKFSRTIEHRKLGVLGGIQGIFSSMRSFDFSIFIIIDFLYQFFGLLFNPRWTAFHKVERNEKIPLSQISSTYSMSFVNGAQILGIALHLFTVTGALFSSIFFFFTSAAAMYYFYDNKNILFISYVFASMCDGSVNSSMWTLRTQIYPGELRKHLLGILRVPVSFAVTFVLQLMKGKDNLPVLLLCCGVLLALTVLSFILLIHKKFFRDTS